MNAEPLGNLDGIHAHQKQRVGRWLAARTLIIAGELDEGSAHDALARLHSEHSASVGKLSLQ